MQAACLAIQGHSQMSGNRASIARRATISTLLASLRGGYDRERLHSGIAHFAERYRKILWRGRTNGRVVSETSWPPARWGLVTRTGSRRE